MNIAFQHPPRGAVLCVVSPEVRCNSVEGIVYSSSSHTSAIIGDKGFCDFVIETVIAKRPLKLTIFDSGSYDLALFRLVNGEMLVAVNFIGSFEQALTEPIRVFEGVTFIAYGAIFPPYIFTAHFQAAI